MKDRQIVVPASEWAKLRDNEQFVELMRLGRMANCLALAYGPLIAPLSDQSPRAQRERFAALFYAAAMLKEALHAARSLGRWFRDLPQYKEGLGAMISDESVRRIESEVLSKIRNELVFHFDRDPIAEGLSRIPVGDHVVLVTFPEAGPELGETYVNGSDDAMLNYLFGGAPAPDQALARVEEFMESTADILNRLMHSSHRLIAVGLRDLGCRSRVVERAAEPLDADS